MGILENIVVAIIVAAGVVFVAWRMWRVATKRERACPNCPGSCGPAERIADAEKQASDEPNA